EQALADLGLAGVDRGGLDLDELLALTRLGDRRVNDLEDVDAAVLVKRMSPRTLREIALTISVSWRCPAERSPTRAFGSISTPSVSNSSRARRAAVRSSIRPRPSLASLLRKMFCAADSVGTRLISWKIMPIPARFA